MKVKEINFKRNAILTAEQLSQKVFVAGVGATGSVLVDLLVKQGFSNITVCDFDEVDSHNITNQNYPITAIGDNKAEATLKIQKARHNADINIVSKDEYFFESLNEDDKKNGFIVFNAIDDINKRMELENMYIKVANKSINHIYVETWIGRYEGKVYVNKNVLISEVDREPPTPENEIPKDELSLCGGRVTLGHEVYITAGVAVRELIKAIQSTEPVRVQTLTTEESIYQRLPMNIKEL